MLVTLENISSLRPHPNRLIQPNHFPIQHLSLNDVLRQRHVFIRPPKSRGKRNLRTQRSKNLVRHSLQHRRIENAGRYCHPANAIES